ncbi:MAG TPA: alpha/beta hydrolase [Solirubrobacteraceae bacterium]
MAEELTVDAGGVTLAGEEAGEGIPVVLLHGLTATRRYVVHGSKSLERKGHRVIAFDARGHGASAPAPEYGYAALADDLRAVLDDRGIDRAVLAGASMGAHTLLNFAIQHPDRVKALAVITPAFDPEDTAEERFERWDRLADGLAGGGVEGFVEAYGEPPVPEAWRETVIKILHQRLAAHEHPDAVADALREVPRSRPFERWSDLSRIDTPAVVVASRDDADPEHPYAIGEFYADLLPQARLVSEEPGESPLAWQGAKLSQVIAELAAGAP